MNAGADYRRKPASVGAPIAVCDVKIVRPDDDGGAALPEGEVGEVWIRGPNVVKGYWNKPEATAEAIVEGWLRSGDLGRLDEEGFLYIVDRAKDMVIRGGEECVLRRGGERALRSPGGNGRRGNWIAPPRAGRGSGRGGGAFAGPQRR